MAASDGMDGRASEWSVVGPLRTHVPSLERSVVNCPKKPIEKRILCSNI